MVLTIQLLKVNLNVDSRSPRQVPHPPAGVWYLALYSGKLAQKLALYNGKLPKHSRRIGSCWLVPTQQGKEQAG